MQNPLVYDASVEAAMNAFTALLNSGFIKIYSGSQPTIDGAVTGTLLATLTFGATAFAGATASGSGGSSTANSIGSASAAATNTAAYFALVKSDGTTVVGTGTCGTSSADMILNSTSIASGATVSCSSFVVTMPQT